MKAFFVIAIIALVITGSGSWGGLMFYSLPVMAWAVLGIFALQGLGFIPAFLYQTERYYDLIGSLTYISAIALVLLCSGEVDLRQMLIAFFILIWAARLGSFLFSRIARDGGDSRFDKIKPSALSSGRSVPLNIVDGIAIALWLSGFAVEVIADRQKRQFRQARGSDTFITKGLWSLSRHPNYFGEIILWTGIALLTFPVLDGGQYLTLVSPLFVYLLLARISGIPLLEHKANRRWGNDPAYITYRENTPVLVPRLKKSG